MKRRGIEGYTPADLRDAEARLLGRRRQNAEVRRAAKLVADFHSRPMKRADERPAMTPQWWQELGQAVNVCYRCDKRDPSDPEGEGAQGFIKDFIHEHEDGVVLYQPCAQRGADLEVSEWPLAVSFIGTLLEVTYTNLGGKRLTRRFQGWKLWVWPDGKVLWARGPSGSKKHLLWAGGTLHTTWRGIEG